MNEHDLDTGGFEPITPSPDASGGWDAEPAVDSFDPFPAQPGLPGFQDRPDDLPFLPVDPATIVLDPAADTVAGDPDLDAEYWLYQGDGQGTCAPTSVAMVLADVLGVPVGSNQEVVDRALELGLIEFDPEQYPESGGWSGMGDIQIMALAESYGLDVQLRFGEIDDLAEYLQAGHAVMVAVDADEVWSATEDDLTTDDAGAGANHELVVTGIDRTNGLVYLNDSGQPNGPGTVIPIEQFADAWADAGNSMIVTDLPEDLAAAGVVAALPVPGAGDGIAEQSTDVAGSVPQAPIVVPSPFPAPTPAPAPAPADLDAPSSGAEPLEDVSSLPDGVDKLLLLTFTFVAQLVDRIR